MVHGKRDLDGFYLDLLEKEEVGGSDEEHLKVKPQHNNRCVKGNKFSHRLVSGLFTKSFPPWRLISR